MGLPRDRKGALEPQLIAKGQTRCHGFADKILSLSARGLTTRDSQAQLQALYGVDVSHSLLANVTEAVEQARKLWQHRSLAAIDPLVYFAAWVVKVRQAGRVMNQASHLALGVKLAGQQGLLGLWLTQNASSKFWLAVLTEWPNRGVKDRFIACVVRPWRGEALGLTGFPAALATVLPQTTVPLCLVHMVRNSLSAVSDNDRQAVAADRRAIYTPATATEAEPALVDFAALWDQQYPTSSQAWMNRWHRMRPFFPFP